MNIVNGATNNLEIILLRQRARRNAARHSLPPPRPRPRRSTGRAFAVVTAVIFFSALGWSFLASTSSDAAPDAAATGTIPQTATASPTLTAKAPSPTPAPQTMNVCAGVTWLHVRFQPAGNAEVRGYLRGGETVTLDGQSGGWALLSAPVAGWVDARYLCGGRP